MKPQHVELIYALLFMLAIAPVVWFVLEVVL
jgi:hypothetical protein